MSLSYSPIKKDIIYRRMVKIRILILLFTTTVVGTVGVVTIFYARGYRLERLKDQQVTLQSKGLLSVNSEPTGAQVFLDGKLETATNNTIPLSPGEHFLEVKKEGFQSWSKTLIIEKEAVTVVNAYLIPGAPSLTALSFSGITNPQVSPDFTKIAYGVPATEGIEKQGIWVYETTNLPLGFAREPRRVSDINIEELTWEWSPDNRELLVIGKSIAYELPVGSFTEARSLINTFAQVAKTREEWAETTRKRVAAQLKKLVPEIESIFLDATDNIQFSPDETKILYTATKSATIPEDLVSPLPGSSTQKQARTIEKDKRYVYDIKEDRNFLIYEEPGSIYWLPNSLNILIPQKDRILVVDYDGTNELVVYTGNYVYPYAFPTTSTSKMVILTNFGAVNSMPNLYSLSLK